MQESNNSFVHIYTAPNDALFSVAKSLLDNAEVEYYTKGTNLHLAYGGPRIIETTQENADEAREILKDFIKGSAELPKTEFEKMIYERNKESSYTLAVFIILAVIFLIILAVLFVKC